MTLKLLSGGSKIDPRSRKNEAKIAPGGLPEATPRPQPNMVTFFAPFFRLLAALGALLGRSWRRLGDLLAPLGPLWALPKALLGSILASGELLWELLGSIFTSVFENREILKNHCFLNVFSMFLRSRGV